MEKLSLAARTQKRKKGSALLYSIAVLMISGAALYFLQSNLQNMKSKRSELKNKTEIDLSLKSILDYSKIAVEDMWCLDLDSFEKENSSNCRGINEVKAGNIHKLIINSNDSVEQLVERIQLTDLNFKAPQPLYHEDCSKASLQCKKMSTGKIKLKNLDDELKSLLFFNYENNETSIESFQVHFEREESISKDISLISPLDSKLILIRISVELFLNNSILDFQTKNPKAISVLSLKPRELNQFALIITKDINLNYHPTDASRTEAAQFNIPYHKEGKEDFFSDPKNIGIRFESPVYINNNLILAHTEVQPAPYSPVTFADKVYFGNGSIKRATESGVLKDYIPSHFGDIKKTFFTQGSNFGGLGQGYSIDGFNDAGLYKIYEYFDPSFTIPPDAIVPPQYAPGSSTNSRIATQCQQYSTPSNRSDSQLHLKFKDSPSTLSKQIELGVSLANVFKGQTTTKENLSQGLLNNKKLTRDEKVYSHLDENSEFAIHYKTELKQFNEDFEEEKLVLTQNEIFESENNFLFDNVLKINITPQGASPLILGKKKLTLHLSRNSSAEFIGTSLTEDSQKIFKISTKQIKSTASPENKITLNLEVFNQDYFPSEFQVSLTAYDLDSQLDSNSELFSSEQMTQKNIQFKVVNNSLETFDSQNNKLSEAKNYFLDPQNEVTVSNENISDRFYESYQCGRQTKGTDYRGLSSIGESFVQDSIYSWFIKDADSDNLGTEKILEHLCQNDPSLCYKSPGAGTWHFSCGGSNHQYYKSLTMWNACGYVDGQIFSMRSPVENCVIDKTAKLITGYYLCQNLIIEERSDPLEIIGTFIVANAQIHESAVQAGVSWKSIYHHDALQTARRLKILSHKINREDGGFSDCNDVIYNNTEPAWHVNAKLSTYKRQQQCGVNQLRSLSDNFMWPSVDPDCGPTGQGLQMSCKNEIKHLESREVWRNISI